MASILATSFQPENWDSAVGCVFHFSQENANSSVNVALILLDISEHNCGWYLCNNVPGAQNMAIHTDLRCLPFTALCLSDVAHNYQDSISSFVKWGIEEGTCRHKTLAVPRTQIGVEKL